MGRQIVPRPFDPAGHGPRRRVGIRYTARLAENEPGCAYSVKIALAREIITAGPNRTGKRKQTHRADNTFPRREVLPIDRRRHANSIRAITQCRSLGALDRQHDARPAPTRGFDMFDCSGDPAGHFRAQHRRIETPGLQLRKGKASRHQTQSDQDAATCAPGPGDKAKNRH